jgi:cell division protein FtsQ
MDGGRRIGRQVGQRDTRVSPSASPRHRTKAALRNKPPSRSQQRSRRRRQRIFAGCIALSIISAGLGAGAWHAGVPLAVPVSSDLLAMADRLVIRAGFGIEEIVVTGNMKTDVAEVFTALALDAPTSILGYDLQAARARIETLNWVHAAELTRVLPDGLSVRIEERQPFAVWQRRQLLYVIDRAGRGLDPVGPNDYPGLPIVVGDGAAALAPALLDAVAQFPEIRARLASAQRIGGRRWTLKLRGGPDILLPAGAPDETAGIAPGLAELDRLMRDERLLERPVLMVDLRLADRVAIRLPAAMAAEIRKTTQRQTAALASPPAMGVAVPPSVNTLISEGL